MDKDKFDIISNLPMEVNQVILDRMTLRDLYHMELACKSWYHVITNSPVWEKFVRFLQHDSCQVTENRSPQESEKIFKKMFNRIRRPENHSVVKEVDVGKRVAQHQ